jgi:16S rRNA (uracil1498-N3)-methyltransferase
MSDPLRFFISAETLSENPVIIDGPVHHQIKNVLRLGPGIQLMLLDGLGNCCRAEIKSITRDNTVLHVLDRWVVQDQTLPITLIQSMPKADKFEQILQKGTELGIQSFQPVMTTHTVPKINMLREAKRIERWHRIMTDAARQCRRDLLPEILPIKLLGEALHQPKSGLNIVLWEAASAPLHQVLPQDRPSGVRLLVGPEGGFSPAEIEKIGHNGFQTAHLGPRILRTETVGLAAASILQYLYGDWQTAPILRAPMESRRNYEMP